MVFTNESVVMEVEPRPLHIRCMGQGEGDGEREYRETTGTGIWGVVWEPSSINSQDFTRVTLVRISGKGGYWSLNGYLL